MISRDGATLTWDAENRLQSVAQDGLVTTFTYDADGRRVKKETPWGTTYYVGEHYEVYVPTPGLSVLAGDVDLDCRVSVADIQTIAALWGEAWSLEYDIDQDGSEVDAGDIQTAAANWPASVPGPCNQAITKYYRLGGRLIALRQNGQLRYVHTDHLSSLSLLTDENGHAVPGSLQRFYPFGKTRTGQPVILPTGQNFTGQQLDPNTGLLYYSDGTSYGRYYDPALGRWTQPDTIIPKPADPQALNRYSYVRNNPLRYTDPSGRWLDTVIDIASLAYDIHQIREQGFTLENTLSLVADAGSLLLPVATGGGALVRAVSHADEAVDVARGLGHVDEALDAVRAAKRLDEALDAVSAAKRLREVGLHADEAGDLIKTLTKASTRGELTEGVIVSLGHFRVVDNAPGYTEWAEKAGAVYFNMPAQAWKLLGQDQELVWAVNQQFLDEAIAARARFHLQIPEPLEGTYFAKEVDYLLEKGYRKVREAGEWWLVLP